MSRRLRVLLAVAFVLIGRGYAAADAITDWNAFLLSTAAPGGRPANEIGIAAAYVHIAIYDAIVAIDAATHRLRLRFRPCRPEHRARRPLRQQRTGS